MVRTGAGGAGPNVSRAIAIITCVTAIVAVIKGGWEPIAAANPGSPTPTTQAEGTLPPVTATAHAEGASAQVAAPVAELTEEMTPTPAVPRIGIVAGHWGSDDGACCPDGLTEVEVNLEIAERVVQSLKGRGYQVDLLEEFDTRLNGYLADALISIHADSCQQFPDATPVSYTHLRAHET